MRTLQNYTFLLQTSNFGCKRFSSPRRIFGFDTASSDFSVFAQNLKFSLRKVVLQSPLMTAGQVVNELKKFADKDRAIVLARFFKSGKGEYAEGDKFLVVVVPDVRKVGKKFRELHFAEIKKLLTDSYHEVRLTGLLILVAKYERAEKIGAGRKEIYDFYVKNLEGVNNWDLVDLSAPKIMGVYLLDKKGEREILYKLAKAKNLWFRRVAMLATFTFIRNRDFEDALKIAGILLNDRHDLIHKAVGWMLREIGKIDLKVEEKFLQKFYKKMPRTMLRYAIERFEEGRRKGYMEG